MSSSPLLIAQLDAVHQSRGGDWYYRTFAPGRGLAEAPGVYIVNLDQAHRHKRQLLEAADVLLLNGVCDPDLLPLIVQRKRASKLTVFEISDDVSAMAPDNPLFAFFSAPENLRLFRRLAQLCDGVQYSVRELERVYGYLNPRGRVFRNQLVDVPALPPGSEDSGQETLNLGWGGSNGHFEDIAQVAPVLTAFLGRHPNVRLHLMCSEQIWRLFDSVPEARKRRTPPGSLEDYRRFVGDLHIGIAPLNDSGFNRSRSDVKFLEYACAGATPVLQSLTPYLESATAGETALLFDSPEALAQQLERLLKSPTERLRLRANAHAYVARERRLGDHVAERLGFYRELLAATGTPVSPRAPQVFAELSGWEAVEQHERHAVLGHTRFESLLHDGLTRAQQPGGLEAGAELLRAAVELEPAHFLPRLYLGCLLESEPDLLTALQSEPRSLQALLALGSLYLSRGDAKAALARFLAAAELCPAFELPYAHAARAIAGLAGAKEAAEFEQMAARLASSLEPPVTAAPASPAAGVAAHARPVRPIWQLLEKDVHLHTLSPDYAPSALLELVEPAPRRVLDVGCFCGGTARWLKQRFPGCQVVGIEMLAKAAELARVHCDQVLVGTLESIDLAGAGLGAGTLDAIVAADVLEHMYNPWQALQRLRPLVAKGGALYVSLPNLRNLAILKELAEGRFQYAGAGILDVTHVRFFTRAQAVEMLEQTGWQVVDVRINPDPSLASVFDGKDLSTLGDLDLGLLKLSGLKPADLLELMALQFFIKAVPAPEARA